VHCSDADRSPGVDDKAVDMVDIDQNDNGAVHVTRGDSPVDDCHKHVNITVPSLIHINHYSSHKLLHLRRIIYLLKSSYIFPSAKISSISMSSDGGGIRY